VKFCRELIVFTHTKIACIIIGGIELLWSTLAFGPNDSLFYRTLHENSFEDEWGVTLASVGFLLVFGSFVKCRRLRHIGLALSTFVMPALGGAFFISGVVTPVSIIMPFLGVMSLVILISETNGKPRRWTQ